MKFPARIPVLLVTIVLLVYTFCTLEGIAQAFTRIIFSFSPLLVLWVVVAVLKDKGSSVTEFREDQEWGYQDREP